METRNKKQETRNKKILIICAGLAGAGKTTYARALQKEIKDCIHIEKDIICPELLGGHSYFSSFYAQNVRHQSYQIMLERAEKSTAQVIILDGYFGDRLTSLLKDYLDSPKFTTKIIYFHCSGSKQLERLKSRGDERDADKLTDDKFSLHRVDHINRHLCELSQVNHLIIDTERDDSLRSNLFHINYYLNLTQIRIKLPVTHNFRLTSLKEAMSNAVGFKKLIQEIRHPLQCIYNGKSSLFSRITLKSSDVIKSNNPIEMENFGNKLHSGPLKMWSFSSVD